MKTLLLYNIGQIATPVSQGSAGALRGGALRELRVLTHAAMLVEDGVITYIGSSDTLRASRDTVSALAAHFGDDRDFDEVDMFDAQGAIALPGFVDSHTHTIFAGSRENEFAMRSEGKTYQEIAASGGGILSTMLATRAASKEELVEIGRKRLDAMLRHGSTTVEIKSGYGLDMASELKMLEAVAELQATHPVTIVPTFLGAHAFPPEYRETLEGRERYADLVINEMLPAVKERKLAAFCDIFCEEGYFDLRQSERILRAAQDLGFGLKLHADQLSASGASQLGVRLGAISVDHLECATEESIRAIAPSETIAAALPGASLFLNHPYPPVRRLIDAGAAVALATDFNPGSSMTFSMPMMMTLACSQMRLTPEEALCASTINGAAALGLADERGSLEVGKKADVVLCNAPDYRFIPYHFAYNHVVCVLKNGKVLIP